MAEGEGEIYSATYSNVPVYELKLVTDHVMRRRSDDWINATHILKIAGFDKPARTRILEREVQKGTHEKIQGGYGKYQGTWVPLKEGRALAEKNGIIKKLAKIFDYVPGDRSPPPAPKHQTAAGSRPKAPKAAAQPRRPQQNNGKQAGKPANKQSLNAVAGYYSQHEHQYDDLSNQFNDDETPTEHTPPSSPLMEDDNLLQLSQTSTASRKRKRGMELGGGMSIQEQEHILYGDELLDYFVTSGDDTMAGIIQPPIPPPSFPADKTIDNQGNNALHWACSMGDLLVTRDLLARGANPTAPTVGSGETPLIRAVLFTNNYDKQTFPRLVNLLHNTIMERDWHGATVFHHIAETARSRGKWNCARYYCEVLINKLNEIAPNMVSSVLQIQDKNHDTAVLCAVRNGCIKVATFLLTHSPEAGDITNLAGETANEMLRNLSSKRQSLEFPPSSPIQAGQTTTNHSNHRSKSSKTPTVSRAASTILTKVGSLMEEASTKLAIMYDVEVKEKETLIGEASTALTNFDSQRHKIRQETYSLMAKVDGADTSHGLSALRNTFDSKLLNTESLLEQQEHLSLQASVLSQDQQASPHAFRSNNPHYPTADELVDMLPWGKQLNRQQGKRQEMVKTVAMLMGEVGAGERIGLHRKLVAIATSLKEDELDDMSGEILESLEATTSRGGAMEGLRMTSSDPVMNTA